MNRERSDSYFEQVERLYCEVDKLRQENVALRKNMYFLSRQLSQLTDHVIAQEEKKQSLLSIVPSQQEQVSQKTDPAPREVVHLPFIQPSVQPQNRRQPVSSAKTAAIGMYSVNARAPLQRVRAKYNPDQRCPGMM